MKNDFKNEDQFVFTEVSFDSCYAFRCFPSLT